MVKGMNHKDFSVSATIAYTFFHELALYSVRPYIPVLAVRCGADAVTVGVISSSFSTGQVLLALFAGKTVDRYGPRLVGVLGASLMLLGVSGLIFFQNLAAIALCSFIIGIAHLLTLLCAQQVVTGYPEIARRGKYVGYYAFANSVGTFLGPVGGGYLQNCSGLTVGFAGAAAASVIPLFCALLMPRGSQREGLSSGKGAFCKILSDKAAVKIIAIGCVTLFSAEVTVSYLSLYCMEIGLGAADIGVLYGVKGLASMAVRPFMGALTARVRRGRLLRICLLAGGLGIAMHSFFPGYVLLLLASGISGAALGILTPLTLLLLADVVDESLKSRALALRIMGNYIGQAASPVLFSFLAVVMGYAPLFWISGASLMLCVGISGKSLKTSKDNKEKLQEECRKN